jgi:hypothetical protein
MYMGRVHAQQLPHKQPTSTLLLELLFLLLLQGQADEEPPVA